MKYQDFLNLNEDEGGFGGGESTTIVEPSTQTNTTDNIDINPAPLLYTRFVMPQIPKEMKGMMRDDLKLNGHTVKSKKRKCDELTPTQSEFNDSKVNSIINDINTGKYVPEPILVSSDNKIVDGHHRWKALNSTSKEVDTEIVSMPFEDLFKFFDNKPYVVKRDL